MRHGLDYAAWLTLLLFGYAYVSGVLCGRNNPFLSGNGLLDLFVVIALSPLFFWLGPKHNLWPEKKQWALTGAYLLSFFLALHWERVGHLLGAQFSLKASDLHALNARAIFVLLLGAAAIVGLLTYHLILARRATILRLYILALCGIPFLMAIATLLQPDRYLHVHHYCVGAFLFPFFRFRTPVSLIAQAVFLGMTIEGISRWGMDPLWYAIR